MSLTTKQYVDNAITSATKLNWETTVLTFKDSSNSNVGTASISWSEDSNFIYIHFDGTGISNHQVKSATAKINTTSIKNVMQASPIAYVISTTGENREYITGFTIQSVITPDKVLTLTFSVDNQIDLTNKGMSFTGTYLFKK